MQVQRIHSMAYSRGTAKDGEVIPQRVRPVSRVHLVTKAAVIRIDPDGRVEVRPAEAVPDSVGCSWLVDA